MNLMEGELGYVFGNLRSGMKTETHLISTFSNISDFSSLAPTG